MSRQLIESILSNNMLEANDMVEAKMAEIRERKMYEMKRMYAAEGVGGLTKAEVEARKKAGYKKASDVLGDPREKDKNRLNPGAKIIKKKVSEQSLDEAGLGDAAKQAHELKKNPQAAAQFRAAMKLRRVGLIPKQQRKTDSSKKSGGVWQRIKQKVADHEPAAPGSFVVNAAKRIGTNLSTGQIGQDLKSIAFRNI